MIKLISWAAPVILIGSLACAQEGPIINDGEYSFLRAQFGEQWDAQDSQIDARLAAIR